MCLSERRSSRVGAEYRLSLAALPKGVFHPKVAVLVGEDETLLLIGSGNLTFGGFGRNVEVLDVLSSKSHSAAFADFTGFLEALARRNDLTLTDAHWPTEWAARLEPHAAAHADSSIRILHNAQEPLSGQLAAIAAAHGDAVEIRCLSPFHDTDADGVISLAEKCGANRLLIGRLSSSKDSAFPFHGHRPTTVEVHSTILEGNFGSRPLHAKCWEIECRDGTCLLVTGSMNATRQALHTMNNIELVTLRRVPIGSNLLFQWNPAEPVPLASRDPLQAAGLGKRAFVQARLGGEGMLTGTVIMSGDRSGAWQASLEDPSGALWQGEVHLDSTGNFEIRLADTTDFLFRLGVQITLRKTGAEARGWLEVTALLEMTRRNWLSVTTTARLLSGHSGPDETAELLNYLAHHAESHLDEFSKPSHDRIARSKPSNSDGKTSTEKPLPISDLQNRDANETDHLRLQEDREAFGMLNHILANIRKRLLASRQDDDEAGSGKEDDEESGDEDRKERDQGNRKILTAMQVFNQNLENLIQRLKDDLLSFRQLKRMGSEGKPLKRQQLRKLGAAHALWFEGNLFASRSIGEGSVATDDFVRRWFTNVSAMFDNSTATEATVLHFSEACLMLAAGLIATTTDDEMRKWKLSTLHTTLKVFFKNDGAHAESLARGLSDGSEPSFVLDRLLAAETRATLPEILRLLLEAPSLDEQIAQLTSGTPSDDLTTLPIFRSRIGPELTTMVASGRRLRIVRSRPSVESCAHCHVKLNLQTVQQLHAHQAARCDHPTCGAFLVAPF